MLLPQNAYNYTHPYMHPILPHISISFLPSAYNTAALLTSLSARSKDSPAVSGRSLDNPITKILISVSSCTGTSDSKDSNNLKEKQIHMKTLLRKRFYARKSECTKLPLFSILTSPLISDSK